MKYFKKISWGNIYLSPINPDDYEIFTKWMNDSRITDGTTANTKIFSLNGEKSRLENVSNRGDYTLAIVKNEGDKLLGTVGLYHINHINQTAEIGISIGDFDEHGKGYGADAINAMLSYAFGTLNLYNIVLNVKSFNSKAISCYKKVGFQQIGVRHRCEYCNGEWYDLINMELLKPERQEKNKK